MSASSEANSPSAVTRWLASITIATLVWLLAYSYLTEFANAVQEALSGLEKIAVKGDEIKQALLQGGSPATPDDLRKRFDTFMNERCKGKDATKLRFVIE